MVQIDAKYCRIRIYHARSTLAFHKLGVPTSVDRHPALLSSLKPECLYSVKMHTLQFPRGSLSSPAGLILPSMISCCEICKLYC